MEYKWIVVGYKRKKKNGVENNVEEDDSQKIIAKIPPEADRGKRPRVVRPSNRYKANQLQKFQNKCDWINPSRLRFWQSIQFAVDHPVHGPGLRAYHYVGEVSRDGCKEFVFGSEQSGNIERNPKLWNRWAATALYLTAGKNKYVDPTELIVLQFKDLGQPRIWGTHWPDKTSLEDKKHNWSYMDHFFSDHYALYRDLCVQNTFHSFDDLDKWRDARDRVSNMLLPHKNARGGIDCMAPECDVVAGLRLYISNSRDRPLYSTKVKIKPSKELCAKTLRGDVKVFVPGGQPKRDDDRSSRASYSGPVKLARL